MLDRGKLAVGCMLTVGLLAAAFAWWWNLRRSERCLALYGSEAAALVRNAPTVEILDLDSAAPEPESAANRTDISKAPGLLNARAALLDDASFAWNELPPAEANFMPRELRFASGDREVRLRFAPHERVLEILPAGKQVVLNAKTAAGWEQFLNRYPKK